MTPLCFLLATPVAGNKRNRLNTKKRKTGAKPMRHFDLTTRLLVMLGVMFTCLPGTMAAAEKPEMVHLRLVDRLDRPNDGYCLDILGTGQNLRLEVPVFAHNCKRGLTSDSAIQVLDNGFIKFAGVNMCITVFGVNGTVLPGTAIILRPCGHKAPYFESAPLQQFVHRDDGRLEMASSGLCLAVGDKASRTYSPYDRWRVLSVEDCKTIPLKYSQWEFVVPG
jgi:hypothetical protein